MGQGYIGRAVTNQLRWNGFDTRTYDSKTASTAKRHAGECITLHEGIRWAEIICGCTGQTWLPLDVIPQIGPRSLLVNMGSSDLEFGLWRLPVSARTVDAEGSLTAEGKYKGLWRSLLRVAISPHQEFYVANGGFPMNFSGAVDPIAPREIQLTRGLLAAGALQALNNRKAGLSPLDREYQTLLRHAFHRGTPLSAAGAVTT